MNDHVRVERLMLDLERSVRGAFLSFVQNVQSGAIMRQVAELLSRNDVEGALLIVDGYTARMAPVLSTVFTEAAAQEAEALAVQLKRIMPTAAISFDPTHPRAAELMRQNRLQFVQYFTESQRASVRQALSQALGNGSDTAEAARAFRSAIGLTPTQEAAVGNYRRLLLAGSREALERDLRDRRFDSTVTRTSTTGEPLTPKQIDVMVERYRDRYLMSRAEIIARTETGDVVNAAREEAFNQVKEAAGLTEDEIERTWRSTGDKRTRDSHRSMDGQTIQGTKTPFVTGAGVQMMRPHDPNAPASERINCRCLQTIRIKRRDQ